tara:strand:- start:38 stop:457 length:420 start_codon:yes stop_codon:yes gene_type:complete
MKIRRLTEKDKKAWLRIVEAFLAIMIIAGTVLIITIRQKSEIDISGDVYEKQRQILEIISKNNDLRSDILLEENTNVDNTIRRLISGEWDFSTNICNINLICPNPVSVNEKEVFATEVVVTSNLTKYSPKKLRFFVWAK